MRLERCIGREIKTTPPPPPTRAPVPPRRIQGGIPALFDEPAPHLFDLLVIIGRAKMEKIKKKKKIVFFFFFFQPVNPEAQLLIKYRL